MPAEAPVISVTGFMRRRPVSGSRILAADPPPQLDALVRRHAEQVGGAPHQIVFQLVALAVGIDDLPHHLDDAGAAGFVERAVELTG